LEYDDHGDEDDHDDHDHHDHGRRMQEEPQHKCLLHKYEDACKDVLCYVEFSSHCTSSSGSTADLSSLASLRKRAAEKCFVTKEEALCCPTSGTGCPGGAPVDVEDSQGGRMAFTGLFLVLAATQE
jgi:hypothetical protein